MINHRWMIRRDMEWVLATEKLCFEFAWSEEEFIRCLRQRNVIGMVAELDGEPAGYMIYELHKNRLHLLNFAVEPRFQRQGVGKAMVEKLTSKLTADRRNRIMLEVRETNVDALCFFRACGFRAISILREKWGSEDAYLLQYRVKTEVST